MRLQCSPSRQGKTRPPVSLRDQSLGGVRKLEMLSFMGTSFKMQLTDIGLVQEVSNPYAAGS